MKYVVRHVIGGTVIEQWSRKRMVRRILVHLKEYRPQS